MKTFFFTLSLVLISTSSFAQTSLTKNEKKSAVTELTRTEKRVNTVLDGLSQAQLNYKSTPDSWSVAECLEHLAISEENIFGLLIAALAKDPNPSKRGDVKMTDAQIIAMISDRSNKVKTSKPFEPTGTYGSHEATLKAFQNKRHDNMSYVKNTSDDLRNRYAQLPFGTIDGYQVLLFMSGHTERHVRQMEEVIADANFPKS